jgi:23S rRNA pseudouridine2605 synthase
VETRIQKFLAQSGAGSRRAVEQLIAAGRVRINGHEAAFGDTVDSDHDTVTLDGEEVRGVATVYAVLNKPRGVLSTLEDQEDRPGLAAYLEGLDARVFPVGAMPVDVEGALLLTNDGTLVQRLNQPDLRVESAYIVSVEGFVTPDIVRRLAEGVRVDETPPARVRAVVLHTGISTTLLRATLRENSTVRISRVLARVGFPVCELRRVAVAGVGLDGLEPGQWRALTPLETAAMWRSLNA